MTTTVLAAIPSPAQGVWHLGPVPIRAYAVCIIVGIVAALIIGDRRWEARGGERGVIYDIALWAVPFGLIGGRLYHVATDWWRYFGDNGAGLAGVIRIWDGGLGIWGAVAFGAVGAWIACRRRGIPLPAFADAVAPGVILAQGIGRLGNYFNQELWGAETTLPWALKIYERRDSAGMIDNLNGVSTGEVVHLVHPTFLYELLWNLLVFAVLIYVDRRFKFGHGRLFALYVAGYCVGRFWIELLRVDDATLIEGVRINSFTATFVFIGAVVYIMVAPKGREDPASLRGKAEPERPTVEDLTEELAAVASTTGVFAAAKAAADEESETVKAESLTADVPEGEEIPVEEVSGDDLGADVAGVPADDLEEAEEFAAEGDEGSATEIEAVAEAEALAEEVDEAPAEEILEAEEFAEARRASDADGVGAVEGEEASDALADAAEAHEAAVEAEEAAEELADEAAAQTAATPPTKARRRLRFWPKRGRKDVDAAEEPFGGADVSGAAVPEAGEAADVGGVGAVEGEEASDALADAAEAHEAAVEGEAAAEELADEAEADEVEAEAVAEAEALADEVDEAPAEEILE
ncbi:prolipoprotein diacylglyceryl transferase, partial [Mycolicibacterium novocastrense]